MKKCIALSILLFIVNVIFAQVEFSTRDVFDGNYDLGIATAPSIEPCVLDDSAYAEGKLKQSMILSDIQVQTLLGILDDNNSYDFSARSIPSFILDGCLPLTEECTDYLEPGDHETVKLYFTEDVTIGDQTIEALEVEFVDGTNEYVTVESYNAWRDEVIAAYEALGIFEEIKDEPDTKSVDGVDYYRWDEGSSNSRLQLYVYPYDESCGIIYDDAWDIKETARFGLLYADYDDDYSTFNSTRSSLTIESECGVEIEAAYLYWFGNISGESTVYDASHFKSYDSDIYEADQQDEALLQTVKFKAPGSDYVDITSDNGIYWGSNGENYVCVADVTTEVAGKENGDFWVANVITSPHRGNGGTLGGWVLFVVYQTPTTPPRNITLWDGLKFIDGGSITLTLENLSIPAVDDFTSYIGFAGLDGENIVEQLGSNSPESLDFEAGNGIFSMNPNEPRQVYNSSGLIVDSDGDAVLTACNLPDYTYTPTLRDGVSSMQTTTYIMYDDGTWENGYPIDRTPDNKYTMGYDAHHMRLPDGAISTDATEAEITLYSGPQGGTSIFMTYVAIEVREPKLLLEKSADVNSVELENTIVYTLRVKNIGGLASETGSENYVIDTLDEGLEFVSITGEGILNYETISTDPVVLKIYLDEIAAKDSIDIILTATVKAYTGNEQMWDTECKRDITNNAYVNYTTDNSGSYMFESNATECEFGSETVVKIVGIEGEDYEEHEINIDLTSYTDYNIISGIENELLAAGVDSSDLYAYTIYYDDYERVRDTASFDLNLDLQSFLAVRSVTNGSGSCEDVYKINYYTVVEPEFTIDTTDISCFGTADGNLYIEADYGDATGTVGYTLYKGIVDETTMASETPLDERTKNSVMAYQPTIETEGDYTIVAESEAGTLFFLYYTVNEPEQIVPVLSADDICAGQTAAVQVTTTGRDPDVVYDFEWHTSNDSITYTAVSGGTADSIYLSPTESIYVAYTAQDGDCTGSDTILLTVIPLPEFTLDSVNPICYGDESITLNGPDAMDVYSWSSGEATQSITLTDVVDDDYSLTVTKDQCEYTQTVHVQIAETPEVSISAPGSATEFCDTVILSAISDTAGFVWSTGDTLSGITVASSGTYTVTASLGSCSAEADYTVTISETPTFSLGDDIEQCENEGAVTLSGPADMTSYKWSTGETSKDITLDTVVSGSYTLTVTNSICTASDEVSVTIKPLPTVAIDKTVDAFCESGTLTATANTTDLLWSDGQTGDSITISSTTAVTKVYTVTATLDGCKNTDNFEVAIHTSEPFDMGADTAICPGDTVLISAKTATSYLWSTGSTDKAIEVSTAGTYTVTITLGACTTAGSRSVTVKDLPSITISGATEICEGEETTLSAAGTVDTWLWSTADTSADIDVSPTATETYIVTATLNDCSSAAEHTVTVKPLPEVTASDDITLCYASSGDISVSGTATSYSWNQGLGTDTTYTVQPTDDTDYIVTGTLDGCSNSDTVTVSVNPEINITPNADTAICIGGSVELKSEGNAQSYVWDNGLGAGAVHTVSPTTQTTYTVTASYAGCNEVRSVTISVNALPDADLTAVKTDVCKSETTTITASGGVQYEWSTGSTDTVINSGTETATYSVTVTDANECVDSADITITVHALPEPEITASSLTACSGDTITMTTTESYAGYEWSTGESSAEILISDVGEYKITVSVTDTYGCTGSDREEAVIYEYPEFELGNDTSLCAGNTYFQNFSIGQASTSYYWIIDGDTTNNPYISVSEPGGVVTAAITQNGCTTEDAVTIQFIENPNAVIYGDSILYVGDTADLYVEDIYSDYLWSNGETDNAITLNPKSLNPTVDDPAELSVFVIVSDAMGCSDTSSKTVSFLYKPELTVSDISICDGETGILTASSEDLFDEYLWSNGMTTNSISVTASGDYSVTATLNDGPSENNTRTATVSVTVNENPDLELGSVNTICEGKSIQLRNLAADGQNYNYTYVWSTGEYGSSITVDNSGLYSVTATDLNTGCTGEDNITVTIISIPAAPEVNDTVLCVDDTDATITLDGENIAWFDADGYTIYPYTGNEYTVDLSTVHTEQFFVTQTVDGCESDMSDGEFTISVVEPADDFGIIGDSLFCVGEIQQMFKVNSAFTVNSWTSSSSIEYYQIGGTTLNSIYFDFLEPALDTLAVQAQDVNGCILEDSKVIKVVEYPVADFSYTVYSGEGKVQFTILSDLVAVPNTDEYLQNTYRWQFSNSANEDWITVIDEDTVVSYSYGTYEATLMVTNEYGCSDTATQEFFVDAFFSLYTPNALYPYSPNPKVRVFKPVGQNIETYEIWIYDKWGNTVWYSNKLEDGQPAEEWDAVYNGYPLQAGGYIWKIKAEFIDGSEFNEMGNIRLIR